VYIPSLSPDIPTASYSPVFGSLMIGSAFNCAAGALALKNQMLYANPVAENPCGIHLLNDAGHSNVELIRCIRYNCHGEKAVICLNKYKELAS
jgi:3-oxoacyl-[acyl-carrier-protein] synthase II